MRPSSQPGPERLHATAAGELARLLADVDHHLQRVRDLARDDGERDLGGSE